MKILIGPTREAQFIQLKKRFPPHDTLSPLYLSHERTHSNDVAIGSLSEAFADANSSDLDVVINLRADVEVDWERFESQILLGVFQQGQKFAYESLAKAKRYDLVFCGTGERLRLFRAFGIRSLPIIPPAYDVDVTEEEVPPRRLPALYDFCFLGNLSNDQVIEYPDRYRALQEIWKIQREDPHLRVFIHSDYSLSRAQVTRVCQQSKALLRGSHYGQPSVAHWAEHIIRTWLLNGPVLLWYVKRGSESAFHTLRDGYNCIFYDETTIRERLNDVLTDEARRLEIVEHAYRSIPLLSEEVYDAFTNTLMAHLANPQAILQFSSRNRARPTSLVYYRNDVLSLSAEYRKHYISYHSRLAALCELIGNLYVRHYDGVKGSVRAFHDFLRKTKDQMPTTAISLMYELSMLSTSLTLAIIHGLENQRMPGFVSLDVSFFGTAFQHLLRRYRDDLRQASAEELSQAVQLFRPLIGIRDKKNFFEFDQCIAQQTTPGTFLPDLLAFFERAFLELYGDAAVLSGQVALASESYARSVACLRGIVDSYRCALKRALITGDEASIVAAATEALEQEPLNTFYTAVVMRHVITGDPTHPGEGPNAIDLLVFERLVDRLPDSELKATLTRELSLAGIFQALRFLLVPKHVSLRRSLAWSRLMGKALSSRVAQRYFRKLLSRSVMYRMGVVSEIVGRQLALLRRKRAKEGERILKRPQIVEGLEQPSEVRHAEIVS